MLLCCWRGPCGVLFGKERVSETDCVPRRQLPDRHGVLLCIPVLVRAALPPPALPHSCIPHCVRVVPSARASTNPGVIQSSKRHFR